MLTEVMRHYGLRCEPVDVGYFETEHHEQIHRDLKASILNGRLISLTAVIGSVKTMAARLKTPLQIGRHLVRAFEAGFEMGVKPIDATTVDTVLSQRIDDIEPQLTRHGYDVRALCTQFDARPPEIRQLMRGTLNPQRSSELVEEMRAAGLPL